MAYYAALTSLSQTLEQIPQPHVQQIASLHDKVTRLLVMLRDLSQTSSLMMQDLERKIRDASYEAADIIESSISGKVLSKSIISCGASSRFWEVISALQNMIPGIHRCQRLVDTEFHGLEQIIDEFESILADVYNKINDERVENLKLTNFLGAGSSRFPDSPPVGSRIRISTAQALKPGLWKKKESPPVGLDVDLCHPVGLDVDLCQLKDQLCGHMSKLHIIPIVGMGGIGKTTLARTLYNDAFIKKDFDTRAWTVVSQEFHMQEMLMDLLDSTRHYGGEFHWMSICQLAEALYKSLCGRRYLIVMDDVWSTNVWYDVGKLFPDDRNGSRIILTTRMVDVAFCANTSCYIHHMRFLSPEASWNLLREKVFPKECCPPELEDIGEWIARNCKGLPLTIVMIGGILSKGERTRDYWEYIAKNINSAVSENNDQFMEILSLSYNSLPRRLKPCFLYMGVFPEDYEIFVSQIIRLWIAEGFIEPLANKSLEEVAEDYLKDLIDRSLIIARRRKFNDKIKTCIIHDTSRQLCIKKAQDEKFVQIMNWDVRGFPQGRNNNPRVSFHSNIVDCLSDIDVSYVRSFLFFCKPRSDLLSSTMSCRLLRVFDALTIRFYEFPIEMLELVHLRYLAFLYRGSSFPTSISKLRNLQTLIALSVQPIYLPPNICEMPQLRHLVFEESCLPAEIIWKNSVVLENLQTVSGITNFSCTESVMKMMPNLKKLGISCVYDIDTEWSSYEFNNFVRLYKLETLKCLFIPKLSRADHAPLPIDLAFPRSLKKLTLSGCRIPWEKMTVIGSLPCLEVLKLKDHAFEGSTWEPNEGEFNKLKFLLIDMSFLEHWMVKFSHFRRLQYLSLCCCPKLAEIPSAMEHILMLEIIELYECSSSVVASAMRIKEERRNWGDNIFSVHVKSHSDYHHHQQQTSLRKVHKVASAW